VEGCPTSGNTISGGVSDWGFGLEVTFLGLPFHFDFAKMWNFNQSIPGELGNFTFLFYFGIPDF
jgi:hypothetical protein